MMEERSLLIEVNELKSLISLRDTNSPFVIIDTRAPEVFAKGHILGALNIHEFFTYLSTSTPDGLTKIQHVFEE